MMADDEMFDQSFEGIGKSRNLRDFRLQHFQLNNHVPKQLPAGGVSKSPVVSQLVDLSDVVKKCAGEQQVTIDGWIVPAHQITRAGQRNHVIQKPADVCVMQALRRRSSTIGLSNF